jgi:hypothetical protein
VESSLALRPQGRPRRARTLPGTRAVEGRQVRQIRRRECRPPDHRKYCGPPSFHKI